MGVLRFFKYILDNYQEQAITVLYNDSPPRKVHAPDVLLIDCNAVFHPACKAIFDNPMPKLLNPVEETEDQKKIRAFQEVCKYLERLIKVGNPKKAVYLAIDGVAGCCKQAQQRKRRFKNAMDTKDSDVWNSSHLSVGTEFMNDLANYIRNHFTHVSSLTSQGIRILLNDMNIPGEGEHKLIRYVENDRQYKSYCIYSPDADLLMLGMVLPKPFITVLRENVYKYNRAKYFLVNMYYLKQAFLREVSQLSLHQHVVDSSLNIHPDHMIKDIVMFFFLLGNDFLPHIPSLEILNDGIQTLLSTYAGTVYQKGCLVYSFGKLMGQFNRNSLLSLLESLATSEPQLLYRKATEMSPPVPDSVLLESVEPDTKTVSMAAFRSRYYQRNFGDDSPEIIQRICNEYLRGLLFVIHYYTTQIPTFDWYYPYHYAPLFCDLAEFVRGKEHLEYQFLYKPPLTPIEALASVVPPSSFNLLPEQIGSFLTQRSFIDERFPTEFEVDLEGKMQDYEAIIRLPMVPYDEIRKLLQSFKLTHPPAVIVDISPKRR